MQDQQSVFRISLYLFPVKRKELLLVARSMDILASYRDLKNSVSYFTFQRREMGNKLTKRCSASRVIRKLENKTRMRCQYTTIGTAEIPITDSTKCWQGCGVTGRDSHSQLVGIQDGLEDSLMVSHKTINLLLPSDPATTLLVFTQRG